jgi:DNA-binding NtrC family response regulator
LFREDLYYRLNVISITMPPLREIREDIPLLINHFLAKHKGRESAASPEVSPEAMAKLMAYDWPGNVRQLENVVRRAFALGIDEVVDIDDLPEEIARQSGKPMLANTDLNLKSVEKKTIQKALQKAGGNKAEAAKLLGVNTTTVYRKMARYDIGDGR